MDIRDGLDEALDLEGFPSPTLLAQAMSRLNQPAPKRHYSWPAPLAAGLIASALVATLVIVRISGAAPNQGPDLPTSSTITGLVSYQFVSSDVGWLNIYRGVTIIAKTSDGGKSWHQQLVLTGLTPTPAMQFIDSQNGVVIGQDGPVPTIWRTVDGGLHWQRHPLLVADQTRPAVQNWNWVIFSGFFLDSRKGWLLLVRDYGMCIGCGLSPGAFDARVYQTTDGGDQWSQLGTVPGQSGYWWAIKFFNDSVGSVSTAFGSFGPVYLTQDGGRTWNAAPIPFGPPPSPPPGFAVFMQAPTFFSANIGYLVATLSSPYDVACPAASPGASPSGGCRYTRYEPVARYLFATSDGGLSWTYSRQLPKANGQVIFIDSHRWIDIAPDGISQTSDLGGTWSATYPLPIPTGWYLSQSQFLDARRGWVTLSDVPNGALLAAGASGARPPQFAMVATSDGGRTWHQVPLPRA